MQTFIFINHHCDTVLQAFRNSEAPYMMEQLLEVLNRKDIGKKWHAMQIQEVFNQKITEHTPCGKCKRGIISANLT